MALSRSWYGAVLKKTISVILVLSSMHAVANAADEHDLGTALANEPELSTYYGLIQAYPEILLQLPTSGGITILAPSNAAFENIASTSLNGIWDANKTEVVVPVLLYHVLSSLVQASSLRIGESVYAQTLLQDAAWTTLTGQAVLINKQPGNEVVFVSGEGTRSIMKKADIPFKGGLVQMIDNFMVPPGALNLTLTAYHDLSFLGALYAADLYNQLANSTGNYTVFAPSVLGFQTVNNTLSNMTTTELSSVMKYHIIPGVVLPSSSLSNGTSFSTLLGSSPELQIHKAGNNIYVNSAQIQQSDILFDRGILHIVDNVLNPNVPNPSLDPQLGAQPAVYDGAADTTTLVVTAAPFTTALPCTADCPVTTISSSVTANETMTTSTRTNSTAATMTSSVSKAGAAALAKCTGAEFARGLGMLGAMGLGAAGLVLGY